MQDSTKNVFFGLWTEVLDEHVDTSSAHRQVGARFEGARSRSVALVTRTIARAKGAAGGMFDLESAIILSPWIL
jgi:hypothetical protein